MQTATQTDYAREIAKIVATMPVERAAQVYDFVRFLKASPAPIPVPISEGDDAWLNDSPEQIAAEDAAWDAVYKRGPDKLHAMAEAAHKEYDAGKTTPLFNERGELDL